MRSRKKPARLNGKSLKLLKEEGYFAQVVECTIPNTFIKKDLFGVFDILAVNAEGVVVFVQVTSKSNASSRRKKVLEAEVTEAILMGGSRVELHLWQKKSNRWKVTKEQITSQSIGDYRKYKI